MLKGPLPAFPAEVDPDRKSTRLNSSHITTSYAVFCLKKKTPLMTLFAFFVFTVEKASCGIIHCRRLSSCSRLAGSSDTCDFWLPHNVFHHVFRQLLLF